MENTKKQKMKHLITGIFAVCILVSCAVSKQAKEINRIVDVSCGICQFDMTGDECELAARIDDKLYYIEGAKIDEHGDAHAEDGFCSTVRKAQITGQIKHGVLITSSFELLPYKP